MVENTRIETKFEVETFLAQLNYQLTRGAQLNLIEDRNVDKDRNLKFTNRYTIAELFPDEKPVVALRRELLLVGVEHYLQTLTDIRYPQQKEWREFGKVYPENKEIYMKFRVVLLGTDKSRCEDYILVMSFHHSTVAFKNRTFPYRTI